MKNAFRFITVSLAIVALAACNQQTTAPTDAVNNNLVLGMGEIPMVAAEGLETQVLSTGINFSAADPSDGAAIDFSVDGPADIVFDEINNVRYVRTRVRVTNNTGGNITNLTLMGIAPRASTVTTLSRLRDLIGNPLSQEEAFNASTVTDPTTIDPAFIPSPTHPVVINDDGGVEIINTRADFVAYDEAGGDLDPIISTLNSLAASNPDFGLTGTNGTDFSLFPFGFQVGSLNNGATGFVDVTFSLPNDSEGIGESPLARFAVTFVAVQDTVGRVTQAVEEIRTPADNAIDAGSSAAEQRLLDPVAAQSNLTDVTTLVLLGSATRDVIVPQSSIVCIDDVRIGFGDAAGATIFNATRNQDAAGLSGACTLNDATSFSLAGDTQGAKPDQQAGQAIVDGFDEGLTITLTDNGQPVVGRVIEVEVISAPTGVPLSFDSGTTTLVTDENGQVVFTDLVLNSIGSYIIEFSSGSTFPVTETFEVGPGPLSEFVLAYVDAAGDDLLNNDGEPRGESAFPSSFGSTEAITPDGGFLAIRAQDEFGNEVDIGEEVLEDREYFLVVELLQDGVVSNTPLFSIDDAGVDQAADGYPARDGDAVEPVQIVFEDTSGGTPTFGIGGVFPFTGATAGPPAPVTYTAPPNNIQVDDDLNQGSLFRIRVAGDNYQLRFTLADTVNNLGTNPTQVLETPEFTILPTVGSISVVQATREPMPAGVDLQGEINNQAIQVLVLDTNGDPISNLEVAAIATQCNGVASDAIGTINAIPNAGEYCNFAQGNAPGGQFTSAGGNPDPNESGVRSVRAVTNPFGIATFSGPTGIQFGVPSNNDHQVTFYARTNQGFIGGTGNSSVTNPFTVEASELVRLFISTDGTLAVPDDFGPVNNAPEFAVADNGTLRVDPEYEIGNPPAAAPNTIFVYPLDRFDNVLTVPTPITISAVTPNPNRVFAVDAGNLSNEAVLRQLPSTAGAPAQFVGGANVFYVAASGGDGAAIGTADQDPAGINVATGDNFRVRFGVTGTDVFAVSQTFDPTPTPLIAPTP